MTSDYSISRSQQSRFDKEELIKRISENQSIPYEIAQKFVLAKGALTDFKKNMMKNENPER